MVGAGVFGRYHASKYRSLPGIQLVAVADPDPEARAQSETQLQVPGVANWRELLGNVDVVSICTPANTHGRLVRTFLAHDAHVLVEKPIATRIEEAAQLIALARSRGLVLTVGHQERFVVAASGLLNVRQAPVRVECIREGTWTGRGTDVSVVLDLMIHDLDLVHTLVPGTVIDVVAEGRFVRGQSHDDVSAKLRFDTGVEVALVANRAARERKRMLRLAYSDGREIVIDFLSRTVTNTTGTELNLGASADPLAESIAGFAGAVRAGGQVLVRPEEALQALETALMIEDAILPAVVSRGRGLRRSA